MDALTYTLRGRGAMLKAHGQPILGNTMEKPMRLSLIISYRYYFPLSMGCCRLFGSGGVA